MELFHAGTTLKKIGDSDTVVTSGGRVLAVVGVAQRIEDAQRTAYNKMKKICFDGIQYRNDIAARACRYVSNKEKVGKKNIIICNEDKEMFLKR